MSTGPIRIGAPVENLSMTVVKTNLSRVLSTLIIIGWIGARALIAQCDLNDGDTFSIRLPLGSCSITNTALVDSLKKDKCISAFSIFPAGPFTLNSTRQIEVFDNTNTSLAEVTLQILPYDLDKHPTTGAITNLTVNSITYELNAGECDSGIDALLDALKVPTSPSIRSDIHFYDGPDEIFVFPVGQTVNISHVKCGEQTYWQNIEVLFVPDFQTIANVNLQFNKALTACPTSIEDVLAGIGWPTDDCVASRLTISNPGPYRYGNNYIGYIYLDNFPILQNVTIQVAGICNVQTLDFGTIPANKCYLNEEDILDKLGLLDDLCDLSNVQVSPEGPYEDTSFTFSVIIDGVTVCSNKTAKFRRDHSSNELSTLFCNNYLNISLNTECEVLLNAETLLEGGPYCYLNYILTARDQAGGLVDQGHELFITSPGSYTVSVSNPRTGNTCWGTVVIEDKFILDIVCRPDTVSCFENNDLRPDDIPGFGPEFPDLGESATWELTDLPNFYLVHTDNDCGVYYAFYVDVLDRECVDVTDGNGNILHQFKSVYHRYWEFEDRAGNVDTCVQKIYVTRPSLNDVVVDDFTANCLEEFVLLDERGHPAPEETGYPRIEGTFYPADICGTLKMTYQDTRFPLCGKSVKIAREWILIDWCNNRIEDYTQVILVEDTIAPGLIYTLEDIYVPNDPFLCGVENLELPPPYYEDCGSDEVQIEIVYEDYDFYGQKEWITNGQDLVIPSLTMHGVEGVFRVVYLLTDECGNTSSDTLKVHIRDTEPPIAVCDEYTVISIGGNGYSQVRALTFDDLSVDNCGIVSYQVRKLNGSCFVEEEFSDVIRFCCEEVGDTIRVEFKVTDQAGNYNTCMVVVDVQDKFPPLIYCPEDVVIDCRDDSDDLSLTGEAWALDNCSFYEMSYIDVLDLNECGEGVIHRTWTAVDRGRFERSCTQEIIVREDEPFTMTPDRWPSNVYLTGCGLDLRPESTGIPDISSASCSNVAFSHHDAYFNTIEGACFKIVREWTVIDWCRYGRYGPEDGIWRYSQIIKQENSAAPEFFETPLDTVLCLFGEDCFEEITIEVNAYDDCSAPHHLTWYGELFEADTRAFPIAISNSNRFTEFLYPGSYVAVFRVLDGCGNIGTHEMFVEIVDCEPPVAECPPFAPSVVLGANGSVSLWISDFNIKTSDNCSSEDKITLSFDPETLINSITFSCEDIPDGVSSSRFVQFYAIDEAGNAGYCEMEVEIKDNSSNLCEDKDSIVVTGLVLTEELGNVENVQVSLQSGPSQAGLVTDLSGTYAFENLDEGRDYTLSLYKDRDHDDGLSTFDLVLIARHAVGLKGLESPYKIIAADVDNNQKITVRDLVWLRQIILGNETTFPNGQRSWRFVDESFVFSDPIRPWPFKEQIDISEIRESQFAKNFIAVKIGDVNGTNAASKRVTSGGRSSTKQLLLADDVEVVSGQSAVVPLRVEEPVQISGLQVAFQFEPQGKVIFEGISSQVLDLSGSNYSFDESTDILKLSWNTLESAVLLQPGDVLFEIAFQADKEFSLAQVLSINQDNYRAEWINGDLEVYDLDLDWIKPGIRVVDEKNIVIIGNQPNPFSSRTSLLFNISEEGIVKCELYDLTGRRLYQSEHHFDAGPNEWIITADHLNSHRGMIIAKLTTSHGSALHRLTVMN